MGGGRTFPMAVRELPSVAVASLSQLLNACSPISTTLSGTTIFVNPDLEKAFCAQVSGKQQVSATPTGRPKDRKGQPLGK